MSFLTDPSGGEEDVRVGRISAASKRDSAAQVDLGPREVYRTVGGEVVCGGRGGKTTKPEPEAQAAEPRVLGTRELAEPEPEAQEEGGDVFREAG